MEKVSVTSSLEWLIEGARSVWQVSALMAVVSFLTCAMATRPVSSRNLLQMAS